MRQFVNHVDHVAWVCHIENLERYAEQLSALANVEMLGPFAREDLGLSVYISYEGGLEIVAPLDGVHNEFNSPLRDRLGKTGMEEAQSATLAAACVFGLDLHWCERRGSRRHGLLGRREDVVCGGRTRYVLCTLDSEVHPSCIHGLKHFFGRSSGPSGCRTAVAVTLEVHQTGLGDASRVFGIAVEHCAPSVCYASGRARFFRERVPVD
jgi:hypothetical protein